MMLMHRYPPNWHGCYDAHVWVPTSGMGYSAKEAVLRTSSECLYGGMCAHFEAHRASKCVQVARACCRFSHQPHMCAYMACIRCCAYKWGL